MQRTCATCACGKVTVELDGAHIYCAACHCDDCQAAARALDALPAPVPTADAYGGTHYVLHRKDRYDVTTGSGLLKPFRLRQDSPTRRMVASCCNSPMFLAFDNAQHWISVYRARIASAPTLRSRIAMRFATCTSGPDDVPAYKSFPIALVGKLLLSRVTMLVGR